MTAAIARLTSTSLKGTAVREQTSLLVGPHGVVGDRLFYLIDDAGDLVNGRRWGPVVGVQSAYDPVADRLSLRLPNGRTVSGAAEPGDTEVRTLFYDHDVDGVVVEGPFSAELSEIARRDLRLVRVTRPSLGVDLHPVTLVSSATVRCIAASTGVEPDNCWRRFRLNIEVTGLGEHQEDEWVGRRVQIGSVVLEVLGQVPRCVVVRQDPTTGAPDGDVLRELLWHQARRHGKEHAKGSTPEAHLGVYAKVITPGQLHVDDVVGLV